MCHSGEKSNLRLCIASHAWILSHACNPRPTKHLYWVRAVMSGEWCWRTNCTLSPFSLRLMESQLERETCIFSSLRTAIFQNVQSLQYIRKDVMVISVPHECPTWEIIVFISCTIYIMIIWPLPVAFNCRQLLKVRADRRKNGRLRKHHYRAVAAYLKVVRQRKPSSAEGTRGGRAREGDIIPPLVRKKYINFP